MDNTKNIMMMFTIMITINIGLAMLNMAVNSYGGIVTSFFDEDNQPLSDFITGDLESGQSKITESYLPTETEEASDSGGFFELVKGLMRWFKTSALSSDLNFFTSVLIQPAGFFMTAGVPVAISLGFQLIWSMLFLFSVIAFIFGR